MVIQFRLTVDVSAVRCERIKKIAHSVHPETGVECTEFIHGVPQKGVETSGGFGPLGVCLSGNHQVDSG